MRSGACAQCGNGFTYQNRSGTQKYCSVQCAARREADVARKRRSDAAPVVTKDCLECGIAFTFKIGRGGHKRAFCSVSCREKRRSAHSISKPRCVVPGCTHAQQYAALSLCNSCYYRLKRTGTLAKREWRFRTVTTHGYVHLSKLDHPLSTSGFVYEHRAVLYDAIGLGPHPCHWCGSLVNWLKGSCVKGSLVPDHLDGDKTNNSRSNLVPACNKCNATRGLFMAWVRKHKDDPYLWAMYQESLRKATA